ncbi:MAG: MerR family transcriptional regulator [Chloroflexi bacterium]|nr:MerR family transcriptional regulator [Chloroflexota bacterium]
MRYTVQAASIVTGVSESRLRTWERRYGVPLPSRSESRRRWYEEADLVVARRMAALVAAGIPVSEAARGALTERAIEQRVPATAAEDPRVGELVEAAARARRGAYRGAAGGCWRVCGRRAVARRRLAQHAPRAAHRQRDQPTTCEGARAGPG